MALNESLKLVDQALQAGNAGRVIRQMQNYLAGWPEPQTANKLAEVVEDYERMVQYWQQGGADPQRDALYQHLLQRLYVIYANVAHHHRMQSSPYQNSLYTRVRKAPRDWSLSAIREEMEGFVSNVAMLELEPANKRQAKSVALYKDHQQQMNQLFEYVLTSRQWSDSVGRQFTEMLASPTIDTIDQQLLIAAVTLSLLNQYDMAKFRMLTEVYRLSQDDAVRQRALVGWALTLSDTYQRVYPEQRQLIDNLLASDDICQELTELQIQLIYCLNEENDSRTIQKEIMPDLLKNSQKMMFDDVQSEEEHLEEVLHPEVSEERMERMESSMRRMMDMQKQGVDVFYQSFSQIKRYPFFYDISNWLVPFYPQHPDIQQFVSKLGHNGYLDKIFAANAFCNSDKYSFTIAIQEVIDRLPEQVKEFIKRGEYSAEELNSRLEWSAAFERRLYLMDLYRFFRLFPHRSELKNPFDMSSGEMGGCDFFTRQVLMGTPIEKSKAQIVRQLKKQKMQRSAERLLQTVAEDYRDLQYYLWVGEYSKAMGIAPLDERALVGCGRLMYQTGNYERALSLFEQLTTLHPEKSAYQLYAAICLVDLERYDEALEQLFRLNYEQPEDDGVSRVLAWAQTCRGKLEQAAKIYEELLTHNPMTADDLKNYGYCLWLQGQNRRACELFRQYCQHCEITELPNDFFDETWLKKRGISSVDINMMQALL